MWYYQIISGRSLAALAWVSMFAALWVCIVTPQVFNVAAGVAGISFVIALLASIVEALRD